MYCLQFDYKGIITSLIVICLNTISKCIHGSNTEALTLHREELWACRAAVQHLVCLLVNQFLSECTGIKPEKEMT